PAASGSMPAHAPTSGLFGPPTPPATNPGNSGGMPASASGNAVVDRALAAGTAAAIKAGLVPAASCVAPELLAGGNPTSASDVYGVGALLYEALVGTPLERGGPRPSDVVPGTNKQIDEIVARACHRDPAKRFGRVEVLGEVVAEALGKGGAMETSAVPTIERALTLEQHVAPLQQSLAAELAAPATPAGSGSMAGERSPAASGQGRVVDRALGAALADSTEKWLISKGRLDYGPFSLADIVAQIEKGEIVAGNIIMDKDTGARCDVAEQPLLAGMVDAARARMDDERRANAEVVAQSREKKRGVLLYVVIGLGVLAAAAGVYFIIHTARHEEEPGEVLTVAGLDGAQLKVKVTMPKTPPAKHHGGGGARPHAGGGVPGGGRDQQNASENLSLDMSDDSDETETLGMDKVFAVYSHYGAQLGGCLQSTGSSQANISIIIDGPSGRVNWVKVNDKAAGPLWSCLNRTMRAMQFPTIHGPRTRAEFDIGL
ncbi:MAG TPA: hypothetical protein VLX92_11350, partial [Kofleriaceae bacterium]|nr:hypothetical protein [Kofleriaceae bacterium]